MKDAQLVKKIAIPASLYGVQLFLQGEYLVILAQRSSAVSHGTLLGNEHTLAIVYRVSDPEHLVLEKMLDVQGTFQDARIVDGELYFLAHLSVDWWRVAYAEQPVVFRDLLPLTTEFTLKSSVSRPSASSYEKQSIMLSPQSVWSLLPDEQSMQNL